MSLLDPRLTPVRPDLAASTLRGQVEADRFVDGVRMQVIAPYAPVRREPRADASLDTQALRGEIVVAYERSPEGWAVDRPSRNRRRRLDALCHRRR